MTVADGESQAVQAAVLAAEAAVMGIALPVPPAPPNSGGTFKVDKENVLQVAKLVQDTADQLEDRVGQRAQQTDQPPAMGDPVSQDVANVFSAKFSDYVAQADKYVARLRDAVQEMIKTAQGYGYTEDEITKALQGNPSITLPSVDTGNQWAATFMRSGGVRAV